MIKPTFILISTNISTLYHYTMFLKVNHNMCQYFVNIRACSRTWRQECRFFKIGQSITKGQKCKKIHRKRARLCIRLMHKWKTCTMACMCNQKFKKLMWYCYQILYGTEMLYGTILFSLLSETKVGPNPL